MHKTRTGFIYVLLDETGVVAGCYALAADALLAKEASGRVRRNMPDPIPAMVLGRLAVATTHQGRGLGRDLLHDAVLRTLQASEIAGFRALLVHALHERAARFYERSGFRI
ncbi:MAG: GNAT family N-acetyltransferase [Phycisphaerales bacterium]|nr:GNAT family N-acetyltransferase [Phycisphaerales bacterium]